MPREELPRHRPQELLRERRVRGAGPRPPCGAARGRGPHAQREDDLPRGLTGDEGTRCAQPLSRVRDPQGHRPRDGPTTHGTLHRAVGGHLCRLPALRESRGHPCLLHRRGLSGRDGLPQALWLHGPRAWGEDPRRRGENDGHPCGLGTNLYLAKIALDITAKHSPDFFGELDEGSYRKTLWNHTPITDFWRVGAGTARRLARMGIHTMGQVAAHPKEPLYQAFGVDAEILIDHAWGVEPVTIADIKAYRPQGKSLASGQVMFHDVSFDDGLLIAKEMADALVQELVERRLACRSLTLMVGYKLSSAQRQVLRQTAGGSEAHGGHVRWGELADSGTATLPEPTCALSGIWEALVPLFRRVAKRGRLIHRLNLSLGDVRPEGTVGIQASLFTNEATCAREKSRQEVVGAIKRRFGRNSLLRGMDLLPGAMARERNTQIGGHRSGVEG